MTREFSGIEAREIQHEIDHLDGLTFLDRVPAFQRHGLLEKMRVAQRKAVSQQKQMKEFIKKLQNDQKTLRSAGPRLAAAVGQQDFVSPDIQQQSTDLSGGFPKDTASFDSKDIDAALGGQPDELLVSPKQLDEMTKFLDGPQRG